MHLQAVIPQSKLSILPRASCDDIGVGSIASSIEREEMKRSDRSRNGIEEMRKIKRKIKKWVHSSLNLPVTWLINFAGPLDDPR